MKYCFNSLYKLQKKEKEQYLYHDQDTLFHFFLLIYMTTKYFPSINAKFETIFTKLLDKQSIYMKLHVSSYHVAQAHFLHLPVAFQYIYIQLRRLLHIPATVLQIFIVIWQTDFWNFSNNRVQKKLITSQMKWWSQINLEVRSIPIIFKF